MLADPPLPLNGSCAECHGSRERKTKGTLHRKESAADPFCSTECCRAYHGKQLAARKTPLERGYLSEWTKQGKPEYAPPK